MSESTWKRQSEINEDTYKTNVTKPKDEKNETQSTICSDMFRKLDNLPDKIRANRIYTICKYI